MSMLVQRAGMRQHSGDPARSPAYRRETLTPVDDRRTPCLCPFAFSHSLEKVHCFDRCRRFSSFRWAAIWNDFSDDRWHETKTKLCSRDVPATTLSYGDKFENGDWLHPGQIAISRGTASCWMVPVPFVNSLCAVVGLAVE